MNKKASNLTSSNLESFAKKTIVKYNPLSSHFSMSLPENSFSMCDSTSLVVQLSAHLFGARTFSCLRAMIYFKNMDIVDIVYTQILYLYHINKTMPKDVAYIHQENNSLNTINSKVILINKTVVFFAKTWVC